MDGNQPALAQPADADLLRVYNAELLRVYGAEVETGDWRGAMLAATVAGLRAVSAAAIAADRAMRPTPAEPADHIRNATEMVAPPAEGELTDYELEIAYGSAYAPAWDISEYCGVHLDGLRAVAAAALAKRFPPADGEAAGRPPLHIAITHQPKTTPPAEGEVE